MASDLNQGIIMKTLDWAYESSLAGGAGITSASDLASEYLSGPGSNFQKANSLVNWQAAKAGTSGFLAGLGGVLTMPVSIPANLASVMFVQVRMIAAIAIMGGHDVNCDRVKTMVFACLTGNCAKDILKDMGIVMGKQFATQAIKNISGKTLTAINQKVGFRLLTKFGEKGVINLGKAVPILGGLIGGTVDSASTKTIGKVAISTFVRNESLLTGKSCKQILNELISK